MSYTRENWPADHPDLPEEKIGVLLVNLGTPEATDYWAVRRYLGEFLSDRRVVELNPLLWQVILQGPILTLRPGKSAKAYEKIWDRERNESPLKRITREQGEGIAARFENREGLQVDWAMRYGKPAMAERLDALMEAGCRRILIFPLYPQYSAATTASVCDQAFRHLMKQRWQPALRTVPAYHDDPGYIAALAASVREALAGLDWEPEAILASFHGLPEENLKKGDPYHCQCQKTGRLLAEALDWDPGRFKVTFQSRFGPKEWLKPYTDETVQSLAGEGVTRLAVITPGFAADCLETLEEIAIAAGETFRAAGGREFTYIPCLNTREDHLDFLAGVIERELGGWL